jgi:hypothetical protein
VLAVREIDPAGGIVTPDAIADALETTSPRSR